MSLGVLATGVWLAARVHPESLAGLAVVMFATLALVLGVGTVFSPQYMILLSALAAVSASLSTREVRVPLVLLGAANAASQLLYPFHYDGLLANNALPVATVAARDALVLAIGAVLYYKLWRGHFGEGDTRGPAAADRSVAVARP